MQQKKTLELVELEYERKWKYLKKYYEAAGRFYDIRDRVVTDEEISDCVRQLKLKPAPKIRKEINLNDWGFRLDREDRGIGEGYFAQDVDEKSWEQISLPHSFADVPENPVVFGQTYYCTYTSKDHPSCKILRGDTHAWYKTRLPLDEVRSDEVVYLGFGSVNLESDVWVNEYPVMTSHLGLFPFKMEITEEIKALYARNPVIAVRVSNTASNIPHMFYNGFQFAYYGKRYTDGVDRYDWIDQVWGGLADDVTLSVVNRNHIEQVFIHTDSISDDRARVCFDIDLKNHTRTRFAGRVEIEVSKWIPDEGPVIQRLAGDVATLPLNDGKVRILADFDHPDLWQVDDANLYLAHIILKTEDGRPLDDQYETFGIRTVEMKGAHFYLNGKKTILQGTHDVCNYNHESVICPGDRIIAHDLLLHKKMGANCSRWPSDIRMHVKKIAQYCDQYGFMLSWTGYMEVWSMHAEAEMHATKDVGETIRSLRNHPSIIIWEMGDEALMNVHDHRRMRWYELVYDLVSREDATRPIIPCGFYSNELVDAIVKYPDQSLSMAERRQRVLEEYPIFSRELAVWDFHHCPCLPPFRPTHEFTDRVEETLGGQKPSVFTEFGTDGLPDPEKVSDVYGGFHWKANAFISANRKELDIGCYGREITSEDWRESQAYQAIAICGIINNIRQHPDAFAAYYFVTMFDVWTFYWGAADVHGNCKLLYFAAKNHMEPVFISALHGNTTIRKSDLLEINLSNYGESIADARLKLVIRDEENQIIVSREIPDIHAAGDVALTPIAEVSLAQIPDGLYSIEYYLTGHAGNLIGKMLELAYIE